MKPTLKSLAVVLVVGAVYHYLFPLLAVYGVLIPRPAWMKEIVTYRRVAAIAWLQLQHTFWLVMVCLPLAWALRRWVASWCLAAALVISATVLVRFVPDLWRAPQYVDDITVGVMIFEALKVALMLPLLVWLGGKLPSNNPLQRSGVDKLPGRGRGGEVLEQVPRARVLVGQWPAAERGR